MYVRRVALLRWLWQLCDKFGASGRATPLGKLCIGDAKSGVGASTLTREGARQAQKRRYRLCVGADVPPERPRV